MSKGNGKSKPNGTTSNKQADSDNRGAVSLTEQERKIIDPVLAQTPTIIELAVTDLQVDWSYQTRPRKRVLADITANLKEGALGVLYVCERKDGSLFVGDGVTRLLGVMARGEAHRRLRCLKYQVPEGRPVEALLFAWWNSNKSKEPIRLETYYQARYVAGVDGGFGALIEKCGFRLNASSGPELLRGIGWVRKAFDLDGGEALERALYAIKAEWLAKKYKVFGFMVAGIALVYHGWVGKSIDKQVRAKLKGYSPDDLMQEVIGSVVKKGGRSTRSGLRPDEKPSMIAGTITSMINTRPGKDGKLQSKFTESRVGA